MRLILGGVLLAIATPAAAQEREYCPERPGIGTPACTMARGRVSVETALADWTLERDSETRTDTVLVGDTRVRVGLSDSLEAQIGWTPFGHVRERDRMAGGVERANRVGDVFLGLKANLMNPDGKGLSIAALPFATLPVGRQPVGAGDWGTGLLVPVTYDLSDTFNVQFTPEIDAAVDEDGEGRHLAFSGTIGLAAQLSEALTGTVELQALRDRDPADRTTQTLAGASLGWMLGEDTQLDAGCNAGLNRASPDVELYLGVSRRF